MQTTSADATASLEPTMPAGDEETEKGSVVADAREMQTARGTSTPAR